MKRSTAAAFLLALLSTGLAEGKLKQPPGVPGPAVLKDTRLRIGNLSEACPMSAQSGGQESFIGSIAAILAPKIVEKGLGAVAGALRRASGADNPTTTTTAAAGDLFYELLAEQDAKEKQKGVLKTQRRADFQCLSVIVGSFSDEGQLVESARKIGFEGAVGDPLLYAEIGLEAWEGSSVFRLQPRYLYYSSAGKEADVALTFTFSVPGAEEPFGIGTLTFSGLRPNTRMGGVALRSKWSTAISYPPVEARVTQAAARWVEGGRDFDQANEMQSQESYQAFSPVTVVADVTTTKSINKWLAAAADILDGQKEALAKEVTAVVLPQQRDEAERKSETAKAAADEAADLALFESTVELENFQRICANGASRTALRDSAKELYKKQRAANAAAIAAGSLDVPYPRPKLVDPAAPGQCKVTESA